MPTSNETPEPWKEFLESYPPSSKPVLVCDALDSKGWFNFPTLNLHCSNETCSREMLFETTRSGRSLVENLFYFLGYRCKHCREEEKMFAIFVDGINDDRTILVTKFGELPTFGPPIPKRLLRLLGDDKDLMLQGRQAENQGLGIGAFSYYRRIIENNWKTLLSRIIEVAKVVDHGNTTMIAGLEELLNQKQFSQAVKSVTPAVPQALLISGENPLLLLHSALSVGIHGLSDAECLNYATDVRMVLSELVEKMEALKADNQQLKDSVRRLSQIRS